MDDSQRHSFIQGMIALSLLQRIMPNLSIGNEQMISILEKREDKALYRNYVESHPSSKSEVTDKDMILCQIDWALENGDRNLFMKLTKELKEMEKYEKTTKVH